MSDFLTFFLENRDEVLKQLLEHIELTFISLAIATLLGVLLGIIVSKVKSLSKTILGFVNIIQTIPSLALLGFLLPILGIGVVPAIVALFLYALLPIVRNTYTGIAEVAPSVKESAIAMGLTSRQLLLKVELPLALPYIMAGIKTASVINVGVATLSAFIAAGGLGKFILQGIQLNNSYMILAGAIPASLLALVLDSVLGIIGKSSLKVIKIVLVSFGSLLLIYLGYQFFKREQPNEGTYIKGGFPSEFIYREDGLKGLFEVYDFEIPYVEMEIGLLYKALQQHEVDLISGFSTDGRIKAYDLKVLKDDQNYFPPYEAAAMLRNEIVNKYPDILKALNQLSRQIDDSTMTALNYEVDELGRQPAEVAFDYLKSNQFVNDELSKPSKRNVTITIGSKAFTENYILAHLFRYMIEYHTNFRVELKLGFGGTKLLMDAMKNSEIDLYPEYTGTALLLMLENDDQKVSDLFKSPDEVYDYVIKESKEQFDFVWSRPLGFNNTFAMLMRKEQANALEVEKISDLAEIVR